MNYDVNRPPLTLKDIPFQQKKLILQQMFVGTYLRLLPRSVEGHFFSRRSESEVISGQDDDDDDDDDSEYINANSFRNQCPLERRLPSEKDVLLRTQCGLWVDSSFPSSRLSFHAMPLLPIQNQTRCQSHDVSCSSLERRKS